MTFYIDKETEAELKAQIKNLEQKTEDAKRKRLRPNYLGRIMIFKKILKESIVLPSYESYRKAGVVNKEDRDYLESETPNGLIIKK